MVKEMNAAMQAVVEDPTVNEGIAGIGHIPGWHDLEESRGAATRRSTTSW